jgi:hypothetical protein
MKTCTCCNKVKPLEAFFEREDRHGHYSWCCDCMKALGRDIMSPCQVGGGLVDGGMEVLEESL